MKRFADFAVVYDISSNKERRKVAKCLKGFGFRIQRSVFECRVDKKGKRDLLNKLRNMKLKSGFVKIYKLEYHFKGKVIGKKSEDDIDNEPSYIV